MKECRECKNACQLSGKDANWRDQADWRWCSIFEQVVSVRDHCQCYNRSLGEFIATEVYGYAIAKEG